MEATVKTYTLSVAKMLAGKRTKNTGKEHVAVATADGSYKISEVVFIHAPAPKKAKGFKGLVEATLSLAANAFVSKGWVGAKEPNGRVTWFKEEVCRVHNDDGLVTVQVPVSMAKKRASVVWTPIPN